MDRPMAAEPNKRNAAYESIFGRPSATHHQFARAAPQQQQYAPGVPASSSSSSVHGLAYAQSVRRTQDYDYNNDPRYHPQYQQQQQQQQYYGQQQYQQGVDPRTGYVQTQQSQYNAYQQSGAPTPSNASAYRQSYYPASQAPAYQNAIPPPLPPQSIPPNGTYSQNSEYLVSQSHPQIAQQYQQHQAPDRQSYPRSSRSATGVIAPIPPPLGTIDAEDDGVDDPALEQYTKHGMTPAQAYQAKVNSQIQSQSQAQVSRAQTQSRGPGLHGPREQPHSSTPASSSSGASPQVEFKPSNGKLDIDFGEDDYAIVNAIDEEEDSELAYTFDTPPRVSARSSSRPYPLQLETAEDAISSSQTTTNAAVTTSPASSTYIDDFGPSSSSHSILALSSSVSIPATASSSTMTSATSPRRSSESSKTLPPLRSAVAAINSGLRRERTLDRGSDRARSMSATASSTAGGVATDFRQSQGSINYASPQGQRYLASQNQHYGSVRGYGHSQGQGHNSNYSNGSISGRHGSSVGSSSSTATQMQRYGSPERPLPVPGQHGLPAGPKLPVKRSPPTNPALLSSVSSAFISRIAPVLSAHTKDGLAYHNSFSGAEAVDKIAYIIRTTDRNLALLLGRALDAQKLFHDVTYDHRLRDSRGEIYQLSARGGSGLSPFASGELAAQAQKQGEQQQQHHQQSDDAGDAADKQDGENAERPKLLTPGSSSSETPQVTGGSTSSIHSSGSAAAGAIPNTASATPSSSSTIPQVNPHASTSSQDDVMPLPTGVFTLLLDCYSPTCSRDALCYSIACPRRLEQQARLNMKPQPGLKGLKKQESKESLGDFVEPGTLWIHSVPQEIVNSVSDTEKKRQEAINEVIYTERDFVRDMEYLRDTWIAPLKKSDVIPEERRFDFLEQVFWNIHDIIAVNTRLRDALNKRQKSYAVVERIGDILLDAVPHFNPFVSYGSHQLYGKFEFEKEKSSNPEFQKFVDETERLPESRKLELNGYLTKPTTRLARYPLLLDVVLKYTSEDNPDKTDLPKVIAMIREFLGKVNVESGKTENRFNLMQLDQQLVFKQEDFVNLKLSEDGRELVYKGNLSRRGGTGDNTDLQVFLFDHALLMVKQKSKNEQHKVHRRPIPLELLLLSTPEDANNGNSTLRQSSKNTSKVLIKAEARSIPPPLPSLPLKNSNKDGFSMTIVHLGRKYYSITLWASTLVARRKWVEQITKQQQIMRERSLIFDTHTISEAFFFGARRVNCAAPFNMGRKIAYGTNDGVYFSDLHDKTCSPVKVLALLDVAQIDILEEYQLLIVLSEHQVFTFPLEALSESDPTAGLRRAKRISSHTTFFKAGVCLGRTLVCVVKASQLSSTIKVLEPIDYNVRGRNKPTFKKLLQGGNDTLKPFREFYIPVESSSIFYLKTKLCVGCAKGFEIVDLETLDTQALLDPSDASTDFVRKREDIKPMAIFRIENDFLLCYDEFAFYVNKSGWRARFPFRIDWVGYPKSFALHYPYILAFDPTFVEIYNVETSALSQVIQGNNLRCLFAETPPSTTVGGNPYNAGYAQSLYGQQGAHGYASHRQSIASNYSSASGHTNSIPPSYQTHPNPSYASLHASQYPQQQGQPRYPYPQQQPLPPVPAYPRYNRDEIIIVSDDRIMTVNMVAERNPIMGQGLMSDAASFVSTH